MEEKYLKMTMDIAIKNVFMWAEVARECGLTKEETLKASANFYKSAYESIEKEIAKLSGK